MSLKDIKAKIKSIDRTRKVTKAMEAVSAVKMRKSQLRAISGRPYATAALSVLERLSVSLSEVKHPLTENRSVKKLALVVVTSDKGLCGVLNAAVLKEAQRQVNESSLQKDAITIYAFGRKGAEYFERRGYRLAERFENVSDDVSLTDLARITDDITNAFAGEKYDQVVAVYTNFLSTFEQSALAHSILPLTVEGVAAIVERIVPEKGKFSEKITLTPPSFYTVEPSPEDILGELLPKLVSVLFYHALLESKASEHSARMVAMKNASDKSRDRSKSLTRTFNKARQSMITREVSEIVGGIEAMATN
jgi:F-type H+-transporting ATPase subunit gamma